VSELYADNRVAGPSRYSAEDRKNIPGVRGHRGNLDKTRASSPRAAIEPSPGVGLPQTAYVTNERDQRRTGAERRSKLSACNCPALSQCRGRLPVSLTTDLAEARADWKAARPG
jgi:hypothetical protein